MTDTETLIALAERCEAATGPDRELDEAISKVAERVIPFAALGSVLRNQREWHGGSSSNAYWLPFYTASLDAAMTLVPEGCFYGFLLDGDGGGFIACCQFAGQDQTPPELHWIKAATPALALCAAALRARTSTPGEA